jgi:hypothetical protein
MLNVQRIRRFLALQSGHHSWSVFETNAFGFVDREERVHLVGHITDHQEIDGLVELLNGASELLSDHERLFVTKNGIGVQRSVQSLITEIATLHDALAKTLGHAKDPNDPEIVDLKKLL